MTTRKTKTDKPKFYDLKAILSKNADYNVIFGERSNGKTYAALKYGLENYIKTGKQMAYIRRWREDLRGKRAESLFANHVANGLIEELTEGKFNEVFYMSNKWFCRTTMQRKTSGHPTRPRFVTGFVCPSRNTKKVAVTRMLQRLCLMSF